MYTAEVSKLIAEGSRAYSAKSFELASEKYGEACSVFSQEEGSDDADLLLLYGKALFQNAVMKSDVFGGKSEDLGGKPEDEDNSDEEDDGNFQFHDAGPVGEGEEGEEEEAEVEAESENENEIEHEEEAKEDERNEENPDEPEQSDFEVAWEILDLTRALISSKIEAVSSLKNDLTPPYLQSDTEETDNEYIILTRKLSETLDLLGEVSLEAENFSQSAIDLQSSLDLRLLLFNPLNSSLISESHYKLSLALEFCVEDPKSRAKAAEQMKLAINSVKLRTKDELDAEKKKDNQELIKDLLVRYHELERDPTEEIEAEQLDMIKGLLGQAVGGAPVNDLSSAVKKKKPVVNDLTANVKKRKGPGKNNATVKKAKK